MLGFVTSSVPIQVLRGWLLAFGLLTIELAAHAQEHQPATTSNTKVYTYVEQMPELPEGGGMGGLVSSFLKHFYPSNQEMRDATGGRVQLEFIVDERGSITNGRIVRSGGSGIDTAALRALKAMPRLLLGRQGGIPVKVKLVLPIACIKPQ